MLALTLTLVLALPSAIGLAVAHVPGRASGGPPAATTVTVTDSVTYRGKSASFWADRFFAMRRLAYRRALYARGLHRTLLASSTVGEAINLAAAVYGNGSWLWRVARCESTLQTDPPHNNPSRGLFQFRLSTFASTPFGSFSVFSPYASALAAGWMASRGRTGEWVCQ